MSLTRIARRGFLKGAGGATLALPWLPSLMRQAPEQKREVAKRFVFVFTANGQKPGDWYPDDATLAYQQVAPAVRIAPLTGPDAISNVLGAELVPFKHQLLLFRGLDLVARHPAGGHDPFLPLSASLFQPSATIDQILAWSDEIYRTPPPLRSLHLLVALPSDAEVPLSVSRRSVGSTFQTIEHETDPSAAYQRIFDPFGAGTEAFAREREALEIGVIDGVREEYELLSRSSRLGRVDKERLEAHAEMLHELSARVSALSAASCAPLEEPLATDLDYSELTRVHTDLLVAALRCDRTRVATLMLSNGTDMRDFSSLGGPVGEHHELSHQNGHTHAGTAFINHWYAARVAELLSKLDAVEDPETGATYLDSSIVYWGNEDGANAADSHEHMSMPVLLAGKAGGAIAPGRFIDYRHHGTPILYDAFGQPAAYPADDRGRIYNSLLISLMQAMGLGREDYEQAGKTGFGDYSGNYLDQYAETEGVVSLPFLDG